MQLNVLIAVASTNASNSSTTSAAQISSAIVASSSGTIATTTTVVASSPKLPSEITGRTVEEVIRVIGQVSCRAVHLVILYQTEPVIGKTGCSIIKEWNAELQERTGKFRKQANAIAEWDRRILQNRDILLRLESEVAKVVETQGSLERQLELIETHQDEVDKALQSMEDEAEKIYREERGILLDDEAASTRDAMYERAELIEHELEQMSEHIKSIIITLNANQGGELEATDGMTPLDVVVRILNNQLSSLMWIDEKAEEFSSRIQKLATTQGSAAGRQLMGPKLWFENFARLKRSPRGYDSAQFHQIKTRWPLMQAFAQKELQRKENPKLHQGGELITTLGEWLCGDQREENPFLDSISIRLHQGGELITTLGEWLCGDQREENPFLDSISIRLHQGGELITTLGEWLCGDQREENPFLDSISISTSQCYQVNARRCEQCGQTLPPSYSPPADEDWTTGIFGCAEDKDSCLTGLFCPCVLFGRNVASMNEEISSQSVCISHAVCIEGGIALAAFTAAFNGIDPDTTCLITEGLLFAWWVCGIYTGLGRQSLQRKYHLKEHREMRNHLSEGRPSDATVVNPPTIQEMSASHKEEPSYSSSHEGTEHNNLQLQPV
ncbi:hypothetical protein RD792_015585 [Penstemon davidsonii]|uniref:Nucleoporin NSP1-like C-terminal domain-containing protein n=1 Tax=Penstemon davidsonii TaxID=160366 RepID=A0ABR0CI38_9LAMI|nr:hypothetical protein RD792_015585 [Penstemon davidsonii]